MMTVAKDDGFMKATVRNSSANRDLFRSIRFCKKHAFCARFSAAANAQTSFAISGFFIVRVFCVEWNAADRDF